MLPIILAFLAIVTIGIGAGLVLRRATRRSLTGAGEAARSIIDEAERRAAIRLREIEVEAEERRSSEEGRFEVETASKRSALQEMETRLADQERNLQRRLQLLGQKERDITERENHLLRHEESTLQREREGQALVQEQRARLERLAGLTAQRARQELVREIESEARQEALQAVRRIEEEAREEALARARRIVAEAMQRLPTGEMADNVITAVRLPNDEMKGRIIGREGRNIRAFEMATGVDLIVDETPHAIILSSFDSLRRAVAEAALQKLIEDGRIHPARIEEVVERARQEMEDGLVSVGESAAFDLGITGLSPTLTRLLGRLKYRVVLGYNLLRHSMAVARLGHQIAVLLGAPAEIVKRAGLLHEVGQVVEGEAAGGHPHVVSADLAARAGEDPRVVQAIRTLAVGAPETSIEGVLLRIADRIVIARPGERDDNLAVFIERLSQLEGIASSFSSVQRAYAMRAGKEVRIIVESSLSNDGDVVWLSKEIAGRVEREVNYPGSVRVNVIRETRAVDFAT